MPVKRLSDFLCFNKTALSLCRRETCCSVREKPLPGITHALELVLETGNLRPVFSLRTFYTEQMLLSVNMNILSPRKKNSE